MTVNQAFEKFMKEQVNLDPDVVQKARMSRDNLLENISEFGDSDDFFKLYSKINIQFGSFARKTKCRELDDIDLMIGMSGEGATYLEMDSWNDIRVTPSATSYLQQQCKDDEGYLNSRKVLNQWKQKLMKVREYHRSDLKGNKQAVVLDLISKVWSFDIVPCFMTTKGLDGRTYYLIPNGHDHWEKTDPRDDKFAVTQYNKCQDGQLLELIRLVKRWKKHAVFKTMSSYLLETMMVNYAQKNRLEERLPERFRDALGYLAWAIYHPVFDLKGIQGNLNTLSADEKDSFYSKIEQDANLSREAVNSEYEGYDFTALQYWRQVLGNDFPVV